jgi:hypothetical protein
MLVSQGAQFVRQDPRSSNQLSQCTFYHMYISLRRHGNCSCCRTYFFGLYIEDASGVAEQSRRNRYMSPGLGFGTLIQIHKNYGSSQIYSDRQVCIGKLNLKV